MSEPSTGRVSDIAAGINSTAPAADLRSHCPRDADAPAHSRIIAPSATPQINTVAVTQAARRPPCTRSGN
jgi:hypothetical protein